MPLGIKWLIVGPAHAMALTGFVMGIVGTSAQRRLWWIAITEITFNMLPLIAIGTAAYRQ